MSDQAEKLLALVNELRWDQKKHDLTAENVNTIENALLELQRLERSAAPSRELVEAAKAMLANLDSDDVSDGLETPDRGIINALRAALSETKSVCEWELDKDEIEYTTSCGHSFTFMEDGVEENKFGFCPYKGCGLPISVKEK